jgi:hypothetical protein
MWLLRKIGIEIVKPNPMIVSINDQFQLLEITNTETFCHPPGNIDHIKQLIIKLYGDQPLKYFNESKRLKIIHLKTATVKDATLDVSSY